MKGNPKHYSCRAERKCYLGRGAAGWIQSALLSFAPEWPNVLRFKKIWKHLKFTWLRKLSLAVPRHCGCWQWGLYTKHPFVGERYFSGCSMVFLGPRPPYLLFLILWWRYRSWTVSLTQQRSNSASGDWRWRPEDGNFSSSFAEHSDLMNFLNVTRLAADFAALPSQYEYSLTFIVEFLGELKYITR